MIKIGFNLPENGQLLGFEKWTNDMKKRAQVNVRVTTTLQSELT